MRRRDELALVKVFDYKEAVGVKRIKNFMPKAKIVDIPLDEFDVRFAGDVRLVFWDYDRMSPPDKVCGAGAGGDEGGNRDEGGDGGTLVEAMNKIMVMVGRL